MKILVVGAGAVGGYFGGRLVQAGRDVDFLVRPARAAFLREHGLNIRSVEGHTENIPVRPVTRDELTDDYDLVLLSVKSYGLEGAVEDLAPAVGPRTVVVPFLNGMRHLDVLVDRFGPDRVYGGVCMVMTRLDEDGGIVEVGKLGELVYGPLSDSPVVDLDRVHTALEGAGYTARPTKDIRQEMWDKWVFLGSLGAVTCLMRAPIGRVNRAPGGSEFSAGTFAEAITVATAAGYPPSDRIRGFADKVISDTERDTSTSMYWDLTHDNPVEGDHIVGDLVARGRELGVPTPLFSLAHTHLSVYSAARG
ncbi:ketopantoate reductase family protein [Nocardiopsis sp. B62]|uniref:ketopantoate reductase family protein n=1 Tax=Nocardiopsis sp. B62 TaxID=2824874 RepID=UPI001B396F7B|nr:ketopantoate reductase family protein [Nocardiopsis sp. B62]MBQ1082056.1 ketopantoate reductase family protein [Nocardiopsis sp. B62]